jgi:hypothetical protein
MADNDEKVPQMVRPDPLPDESPRQKNQTLPGHSQGDHRKAVRRGDPFTNKNSLVKWSTR